MATIHTMPQLYHHPKLRRLFGELRFGSCSLFVAVSRVLWVVGLLASLFLGVDTA